MRHVSFVLSELPDVEKCDWMCLPPFVTPCHVGKDRSNLVVESRDEILLKGVGCDAPGF
jgi:hypothetical protein